MANLILAVDTATDRIGLSLTTANEVLAESIWRSDRFHTVELAPRAAMMMLEAGYDSEQLDGVAVAQGPGSYTGLRIGMAFAKGLALAHGLPLYGVPTLDPLARMQPERDERLLAVLQAGRDRIGAVWYKWVRSAWRASSDAFTSTWESLLEGLESDQDPAYVCGEIQASVRPLLERHRLVALASPALCLRRPSFLAELAREQAGSYEPAAAAALSPKYLGDV